ncbi:MAG TPA: ATP-binding protein [Azospirillaceae bacterium]|nr:ATP-binding protein [Azospirillaceae bacterium]
MRLFPDTIAGRTVLVLLAGLVASHLVSVLVYQADLVERLGSSSERSIAERIVATKRLVGQAPPAEREAVAHAASTPLMEVHWSSMSLVRRAQGVAAPLAELETRLRDAAPEVADDGLLLSYADGTGGTEHHGGAEGHLLLASTRLPDGSWVNFTVALPRPDAPFASHVVLSTTLMAAAIFIVAIGVVRLFTRPLGDLARAAERFGRDVGAPALPEEGPREVRLAAAAFNGMQRRIRKLLEDRTQTLAAVSHDLRTPITRLRLRAEFVEDDAQRERMLRDLDEMEQMVSSALAFLKEGVDGEPTTVMDLSTLVETVCDEMADAGMPVVFAGGMSAPLACRPLSLKRAFTNIVENAVKYGGGAEVHLSRTDTAYTVVVGDRGPGVPEAERERIFDPFYRIEASRSRETGGTGLGLTVARTIVRAHDGDIQVADRPGGGLLVTATLPRNSPPHDRRAPPRSPLPDASWSTARSDGSGRAPSTCSTG